MTQQSVSLGNIASWIVPDSSGQHQIIKVIQTSSKANILPTTSRSGNLTTALKAVVKPITVDTSQGTSGQIICFKATKGIPGNTGKRLIIPAANIKQLKAANGTAPLILKQLSESDAQALYSPNCTNAILTQARPSNSCNSKTAIEGSSNVTPTSQYNAKLDDQVNSESYCITPKQKQNSKCKSFITPILDHSGSRKRQELDIDLHFESNKKRRSEKGGVGLRQFSMKVCEKVKAKGITSYNEVADELVAEFADGNKMSCQSDQQYDQKNIRRRVYDALNVLMAMDIISKEKKEIKWIGLPTNSAQECKTLENEKKKRNERIKYKTQQLHDLILQQIAFKNLVAKNKALEASQGPPAPNTAIQLPFIIVNTDRQTVIDCSISSDKMEYLFNFNDTFEIHDDIEVLKRMGFTLGLESGQCSEQNLHEAKSLVPKALSSYVEEIANNEQFADVTSLEGLMSASSENDVMMELMLVNQNASRPSSVLSYGGSGAGTATPSIADYESEHDSDDSSASEMF